MCNEVGGEVVYLEDHAARKAIKEVPFPLFLKCLRVTQRMSPPQFWAFHTPGSLKPSTYKLPIGVSQALLKPSKIYRGNLSYYINVNINKDGSPNITCLSLRKG